MEGRIVVIADSDPLVAGALAQAIQGQRRRVIVCGDAESVMAVTESYPVSLLLADTGMGSRSGHEGFDLVHHVSGQTHRPRVAVMTGLSDPWIAEVAMARGAVAVLEKPVDLDELESLIVCSSRVPIPSFMEFAPLVSHFPSLEQIVEGTSLTPVYQPIFDLTGHPITIHGFESMARYPEGAGFADIPTLLRYAELSSSVTEIEAHLLRNSLEHWSATAGGFRMFLSVHPATLADGLRIESILRASIEGGGSREDIVIEITEAAKIRDRDVVCKVLTDLHGQGVKLALDDLGASDSNLWLFDKVPLDYVKIGSDFGSGFERDEARTRIVRSICHLASDFGVAVVLEGIETSSTLEAARAMGIQFGQGFHVGMPVSNVVLNEFVDQAA